MEENNLVSNLKIMFLGGVGEIGKNMTVFQYENDIIVVDAGLTFPSEDMPGIDLVVPDIIYLVSNKEKVKGIVLTHGHEDHIGGLPYMLGDINAPIYGSRLTLALVENKMREHQKIQYKSNTIKEGSVIKLGVFNIEFIRVNHSIAGAMALAITTPVGIIVFTGDYKVDYTPMNVEIIDLARFAELGKRGVLLLMADSTNAERAGHSMSERVVGQALDEIFAENATRRLFVATFSSNIHRLQQIFDLAVKYKRKVAFSGRSMLNVTDTAIKIGELRIDKEIIIDVEKADKYADKELVVITTGSQGEPMSALTRMASGEFNKIKIGDNDTIILSSSSIPGNEKMINRVINNLVRLGANVIYNEIADVHASGHAYIDEIKLIHALVKPRYFIPVHGEYKHLKAHADIAITMGMQARDIIMPDLGLCVELNKNVLKIAGTVPAGKRLVDGLGLGDLDSMVLKDRKQLAEDGLCIVVLGLSDESSEIVSGPDIITRGLIYSAEASNMVTEAKESITDALKELDLKQIDRLELKSIIRKALTVYFFKKTKRRPMILPIILEQ
ncbi:MAG: ribonuclease J [Clostridia bacterium]|jgi:ribonuclease J|nr:ribonuclease J [Clostridia bacterium]